MFEDLMKQNKSIMDAYTKMKTPLAESDDTGGDGSAYNKYVLAKTGDLPKDKEAYEKAGVEEGVVDTLKKVGAKVLDTLGHKDDKELLKDLKDKAGVRNPDNAQPSMAKSDVEKKD